MDFKSHFSQQLDSVTTALLPHHGSNKNWNAKVLEVAKDCLFWISSAGYSNQYSHPSLEVLEDIMENGKWPICCNELKKVKIQEEISF